MKNTKSTASLCPLASSIACAMEEKQAEEVQILDLRHITYAVTDYFVLCTAQNSPHMDAIVTHIETFVRSTRQERPWFVEGISANQWVLLDYVNVVAHVFGATQRAYYALEELWGDAPILYASKDIDTQAA